MISLLAIPLMAFLARLSGIGTAGGQFPAWLPEALFAALIGAVVGYEHGWPLIFTGVISYVAMQAGHGTVYNMRGWESSDPGRIQTLERPIRPIFRLFGWSIYQPGYSWAVMGLKGFLIGLPLFPFGLLMALLWPLAYDIKDPVWGEWISGAFVGVIIIMYLWL